MLISIIIPVYNTEKFVERCINSCEAQNLPKTDYEIIVINDGSVDGSLKIIANLAEKYPNIIVFSQSNAGLSVARNVGMHIAKGQYFMFVDSDDWIAENCLKSISDKLLSESPDILAICAADFINGKFVRRQEYTDPTPISGPELILRGVSPCAPFAIWSASFLKKNHLEFYKGIFHEDSEFTPRAYYYAQKVSFINKIVYFVYQNPKSITRTINPQKSYDLLVVCNNLLNFSSKVDKNYKKTYYDMISMYLNNALNNILFSGEKEKQKFNALLYENRNILVSLRKSTKIKYKVEYCLFKLMPLKYVQIYNYLTMIKNY